MNPYTLPNDDKNAKLEEVQDGLILHYVLPCNKEYPKKTFQGKNNTWWVRRSAKINYQNNMSVVIIRAYYFLKDSTMLELALFEKEQLEAKIYYLKEQLLK